MLGSPGCRIEQCCVFYCGCGCVLRVGSGLSYSLRGCGCGFRENPICVFTSCGLERCVRKLSKGLTVPGGSRPRLTHQQETPETSHPDQQRPSSRRCGAFGRGGGSAPLCSPGEEGFRLSVFLGLRRGFLLFLTLLRADFFSAMVVGHRIFFSADSGSGDAVSKLVGEGRGPIRAQMSGAHSQYAVTVS